MNTKYLIVCAGKYGSTLQTGRWIGERLEGEVTVVEAVKAVKAHDSVGNIHDMDVVILGSGIYSHTVLPEIKEYVELHRNLLAGKKTAVFGVAIDTTGVFVRGKVHGGWDYIMPLIDLLPNPPVHAGLLGGEINPLKLDEKDSEGLKKFYTMMGLGNSVPFKTRMTKQAAWEYAEKLMQRLTGAQS
jgi:menaquinone-dependent protoporphyrinogen IX oxidase